VTPQPSSRPATHPTFGASPNINQGTTPATGHASTAAAKTPGGGGGGATQRGEESGSRATRVSNVASGTGGGGGDGEWVHIGAQESSVAGVAGWGKGGRGGGGTNIASLSASLKEKLPSVGKFGSAHVFFFSDYFFPVFCMGKFG
jgi:hypothetical protein